LLSTPDKSWLKDARGKAVKIVIPLLTGLPLRIKISESEQERLYYRIIYMEREMGEILQSQDSMRRRLGRAPAAGDKAADIGKAYRQQERHAKTWCAGAGIHAMSVSYEALVQGPDEILGRLAAFLGVGEKLAAMRACIDPALRRARV